MEIPARFAQEQQRSRRPEFDIIRVGKQGQSSGHGVRESGRAVASEIAARRRGQEFYRRTGRPVAALLSAANSNLWVLYASQKEVWGIS